jgi:hypothetical protein
MPQTGKHKIIAAPLQNFNKKLPDGIPAIKIKVAWFALVYYIRRCRMQYEQRESLAAKFSGFPSSTNPCVSSGG